MHQIYCLMAGGAHLTDVMRTSLFRAARSLFQEQKQEARIRTDDLEGVVKTKFKTTGLGDISGVLFHAELDSAVGRATVDYFVRARDMEGSDPEDLTWRSFIALVPVPIAPEARNAQWN